MLPESLIACFSASQRNNDKLQDCHMREIMSSCYVASGKAKENGLERINPLVNNNNNEIFFLYLHVHFRT